MVFLQEALFTSFGKLLLLLNSSFFKLPAKVQPPLSSLQSELQAQNWQAELHLT